MRLSARSLIAVAALALPGVAGAVFIQHGLGDDFTPVRWLATGGPAYGQSYLYAYPLPAYLPALPLAVLPAPWSHALVLALCFALLGIALWLWGTPWRTWLLTMLSTPVVYGLFATHVFISAALLGCTLALWASGRRRVLLLGLGLALAAIRPVNALPLLAVIVWAWRSELRGLAAAGAVAVVVWAPFTAWAFAIDPRWLLDYVALLRVYPVVGLIRFVYDIGPAAYVIALIALAAVSVAVAALRGPEVGAVVGVALSVAVAPLPGTYAAVFALPALLVAARRSGYEWLPGIVSAVGWLATIALLMLGLPLAVVAYWYILNCYPLLLAPAAPGIPERTSIDEARPRQAVRPDLTRPLDPGGARSSRRTP
jgi:hypothetical protein